jgi:hypothetical protein
MRVLGDCLEARDGCVGWQQLMMMATRPCSVSWTAVTSKRGICLCLVLEGLVVMLRADNHQLTGQSRSKATEGGRTHLF